VDDSPAFVSVAWRDVPRPDFVDVAAVVLPAGATSDPRTWAEEIFSVRSAPLPVKLLMGLRQLLAPLLGIPRATSDVFAVRDVVGEEALIAYDDVHLDFRVGVGVDPRHGLVRLTTVVRLKGLQGRVYFLPVRLLHSVIVHSVLAGAARRLARRAATQ
jgi:Protein of unknown function (DUF2867)